MIQGEFSKSRSMGDSSSFDDRGFLQSYVANPKAEYVLLLVRQYILVATNLCSL